ncbi:MAG: prolipoprotein diacylglyceryl transferase [Ruminiclostridium sp.]|nr:prolipoprotein diacylglyceryl transferase [Ruminiclostridium sp.]
MNLVEFPGLWGLKFTISRVAFEVFGLPIYWYGIIIASGFLLAVLLGMRTSRLAGIEPDSVLDLVLYGAPVAIICARLYYVVFSWELFKDNPLDIVDTRKGGLAIYGAILGALAVAYFYSKKKKVGFFRLMDFAAPYIVMAQGIGRWGNFVNQEAFGSATSLPWRMNSETVNSELLSLNSGIDLSVFGAHPTFLYESLWNFAVFFFLIWYRKRKKLDGEVFFLYMLLYGVGRFFIEGLRTDSLMLGSFRVSQLLAFLFVIMSAFLFIYRRKKADRIEEEATVDIGQSQYGSILSKLREENEIAEEEQKPDEESVTTIENGSDKENGSDAHKDKSTADTPVSEVTSDSGSDEEKRD